MENLAAAAQEIETRLMGDFVGVWEVVAVLSSQGILAPRAACEAVIAGLLANGTAVLGDLRQEGFVPWQGETEACLAELRARWDKLGRTPDIGDIGWLNLREG